MPATFNTSSDECLHMKVHQWLLNVSFLALTIAFSAAPAEQAGAGLMNSLAKEGFVVHELCKSKTVSVLLERLR